MSALYKHHIIPKHIGGSDDPSNMVLLTLEEHAEAHMILYILHQRWQDYVAWMALEGAIGKEEIIKLKQSLATKGKKQSSEHIEKRKLIGEKNPMYGKVGSLNPMYGKRGELNPNFRKKHTEQTLRKKRNALIGKSYEMLHGKEKADLLKQNLKKPKSEEHKNKLRTPKPKTICRVYDKKEMAIGNFMNWYKNNG